LLGYNVLRLEGDDVMPDRVMHFIVLVAPPLGCPALKEDYTVTLNTGEERLRSSYEVTSLIPGDPNAALFEIPGDYVERPPSEVLAEEAKLKSQETCTACQSSSTGLDEAYRRQRPR
jgi:hypothetical protein